MRLFSRLVFAFPGRIHSTYYGRLRVVVMFPPKAYFSRLNGIGGHHVSYQNFPERPALTARGFLTTPGPPANFQDTIPSSCATPRPREICSAH